MDRILESERGILVLTRRLLAANNQSGHIRGRHDAWGFQSTAILVYLLFCLCCFELPAAVPNCLQASAG